MMTVTFDADSGNVTAELFVVQYNIAPLVLRPNCGKLRSIRMALNVLELFGSFRTRERKGFLSLTVSLV